MKSKNPIFQKHQLYLLFTSILSLFIFAKLIEDVVNKELIANLDIWMNANVISLYNPFSTDIMKFITDIANPAILVILSAILLIFLIYKKRWNNSLILVLSMVGGLVLESLTKLIIHRPRPENALLEVSGYSFPSAHATMAIIFFSFLIYSFKDKIKNKLLKISFIAANIILFLLIGFSRIYLNVHWVSDIIAGFALGLFWVILMILVFKLIKSPLAVSAASKANSPKPAQVKQGK